MITLTEWKRSMAVGAKLRQTHQGGKEIEPRVLVVTKVQTNGVFVDFGNGGQHGWIEWPKAANCSVLGSAYRRCDETGNLISRYELDA